ncbi:MULTISPECIES: TetR/AcrR family transcriptional regulator [Rhizobium/Agrobacterium group]|uniref:TetR/AcrR family transcriptional regulator n=1 Tax=Rhizobium/Agrobacterium group TaxID=227290 RepID=UPI001FDF8FA4|nr:MULTISPECIES: TetR/AcrR family transcriptional regulator [Rhizobium/Agrobacterium group]
MTIEQNRAAMRVPRADARRNRDAILRAAQEVFQTDGVLASLDGIALRAGVGNATLYRNFPAREDLLAAVMTSDLDEAIEKSRTLGDIPPRQALSEWLVWLSWRLRIWHDLPQCIAQARDEQGSSLGPTVSLLEDMTGALLARAQAAGVAVASVGARDVFELATALSWAIDRFRDKEDAARTRVEIATAGLFI